MSIEHTFETPDEIVTKTITKAKAIRAHCLDCCGFSQGEVAKCTCHLCALYPFRFGNEKGLERMYVDEGEVEPESEEEKAQAEEDEWAEEVAEDE